MSDSKRTVIIAAFSCILLALTPRMPLQAAEVKEYNFQDDMKYEVLTLEDFGFKGETVF